MLPWWWRWTDNGWGVSLVIQWSFLFVTMIYAHFRLKRKDWSLALFVGLLFVSISMMNLFLRNDSVGWVNEIMGGQ